MKIITVVVLLFTSIYHLYSFEYQNNISFGLLGASCFNGISLQDACYEGKLINFVYHSKFGIGITFSPMWLSLGMKDLDVKSLTFLNATMWYNVLRREHFILGPFVAVNILNYNRIDFFESRCGFMFLMRNIEISDSFYIKDSVFGWDYVSLELGYKYNNNGQKGFYAYAGIDLLGILYLIGMGYYGKDVEKYQKDHPVY